MYEFLLFLTNCGFYHTCPYKNAFLPSLRMLRPDEEKEYWALQHDNPRGFLHQSLPENKNRPFKIRTALDHNI
jgi:hypothetical protein